MRENLRLGLVAAGSDIDERVAIDEIVETFSPERALDREVVPLSDRKAEDASARRAFGRHHCPSRSSVLFRRLRDEGKTLLLVEQNVQWARLPLADQTIGRKQTPPGWKLGFQGG